jgi:hypothetical protein
VERIAGSVESREQGKPSLPTIQSRCWHIYTIIEPEVDCWGQKGNNSTIKTGSRMILNGEQRRILKGGILGAYPNEDELKILLSKNMNLRYNTMAIGEDYISRVAYLIENLEADGKAAEFIRVIVEKKPNSPFLEDVKKFCEIEKIPSTQVDYSSTPVDRNQLLNIFKGLMPAQFSELVFVLNVPDEYLPGQNTPQSEKAIALLKWASSPGGIGLNRLQAALDAIIDGSVTNRTSETLVHEP